MCCRYLSIVIVACLAPADAVPVHADIRRSNLPAPVSDDDYHDNGRPAAAKVELGRLLFFDRILSGNRNIACATCHHPRHATSDAVALSLGEGPRGVGPHRRTGSTIDEAVHGRVPRNAPSLFNRGAREFTRMFWDGRVEVDPHGYYEGGFVTPAKWKLPPGLENVLAAQAMFPVATPVEMAGQKGENPVADAVSLNNAAGPAGVWELLADRLREIPEYVDRFRSAFPERVKQPSDITFVDAANAIAAFENIAFRSDDSPFDRFLAGDDSSLNPAQKHGMDLFYGRAGCANCHAGKFQTDHDFHSIAMPQIGPGKADGRDGSYWRASGQRGFVEDFGRGRVTIRSEDRFKFKTPSLRNVALTGPWGHTGAYDSLESVVRHHANPVASLERYRLDARRLPRLTHVVQITAQRSRLFHQWMPDSRRTGFLLRDGWVQQNADLRGRIAAANELSPVGLSNDDVRAIVAFLHALSDPSARELTQIVPRRVPSGLPVDQP